MFLPFLLHLGQHSCLQAHRCSSFLLVTVALGSDNVASLHCPPEMVSWYFKAPRCLTAPPGELHSQQIHHWDHQFPGLNSLPLTPREPKKANLPASFNHDVVTAFSPFSLTSPCVPSQQVQILFMLWVLLAQGRALSYYSYPALFLKEHLKHTAGT